jgi:hypothetical protein
MKNVWIGIKRDLPYVILAFGFTALLLFSVWVKFDVWNECRAGHSFFYCLSLISH